MPDFYNLDDLEQLAVNLFYGWGYNFYRLENQLRADDLTVRAKVGGLLNLARASVEAAEAFFAPKNSPPLPARSQGPIRTPWPARRPWKSCPPPSGRSKARSALNPFPRTTA